MRWEDERYVRVYTRDTVDWLGLSFIAQGLFCLILRKVDRAGLLKLGKHGKRAVSIVIGHPGDWPRLEPALEELLADGCVEIRDEFLVVPNFIEAQEATQSDAQRKREQRGRDRDLASAKSVLPDIPSRSVTVGHEAGQKVTTGHKVSQAVTPSLAVPSRAEPAAAVEASAADDVPRRPILVEDYAGAPRPTSDYPLAEEFRHRVSERMARTNPFPWGAGAETMKALQARLGPGGWDMDAAVEHAYGCAVASKNKPKFMSWFARCLEDEPVALAPVRAAGECPRWGDADWDDPAAWPSTQAYLDRSGPAMPVVGGAVRRVQA